MKKLISYATIALLATIAVSTAAPSQDEIMAKENAAWQAFKDKNADGFKKVVSADIVGIYDDGIHGMQGEIDSMKKMDMKSFAISDFKVVSEGPNLVITTYTVKVEGTVDGKDASGTYNAGSVWKMGNGKWLAIFHTNILQAAGASAAAQKKE
ncbi:MAG TPA: nuclear transport factor 2 family protein [Chthoniobacterales bacterium]|jgi:hypothetical protein